VRSAFGLKVVPAKAVIAALPDMFNAKQAQTRDAAKILSVRLTRSSAASLFVAVSRIPAHFLWVRNRAFDVLLLNSLSSLLWELLKAQHNRACRQPQVAACQWLGSEAVQGTLLDKMPDAMRKDVEKAVAAAPDRPKPPRCTRKEAAKRAAKVWSIRS